jgi:hypothetical protein
MWHFVFQDFAHHVTAEPSESVGPWRVYPVGTPMPDALLAVLSGPHTAGQLVALRAEIARDYGDSVPPISPQPLPEENLEN